MITRQCIEGGIYGLAVGDALGLPFEEFNGIVPKDGACIEMTGGGTHGLPKGTWSDDTALTIATLRGLGDGYGIDRECIIKRLCAYMDNGESSCDGTSELIGSTTKNALERYKRGYVLPWKCGGTEATDNGNGSLMRILPVVLYCLASDGKKLSDSSLKAIGQVSGLTHGTRLCKAACGIYALAAAEVRSLKERDLPQDTLYKVIAAIAERAEQFYGYNGNAFDRIKSGEVFALRPSDVSASGERLLKSTGYVAHCLEAALWCFINTETFAECVLMAVRLGGDTDTTAAVAGGLAGLYYGIKRIPMAYINALRNKDIIERGIGSLHCKLLREHLSITDETMKRAQNFSPEALINLALFYKRAEDFELATRLFGEAAEHGSIEAMYLYERGLRQEQRMQKDEKRKLSIQRAANDVLERAAEAGSLEAKMQLHVYCANGVNGIDKDEERAKQLLTQAAEGGLSEAQYSLGHSFFEAEDYANAEKWWSAAAEQQHAVAEYMLGTLYEKGLGVLRNEETALKWFRLSASRLWHQALVKLGDFYKRGREIKKAEFWYRQAALQNNGDAMCALGSLYLEQDKSLEALYWLENAVRHDNDPAMAIIGDIYQSGTEEIDRDYTRALQWYKRAQRALGGMDDRIEGVELLQRRAPKGYDHMCKKQAKQRFSEVEKLVEVGDPAAMMEMAWCYYFGFGTSKDEIKGFEWFERAWLSGSEYAERFYYFDELDY